MTNARTGAGANIAPSVNLTRLLAVRFPLAGRSALATFLVSILFVRKTAWREQPIII